MKVSYEVGGVIGNGAHINKSASQCRQGVVYVIALVNAAWNGTRLLGNKKSEPISGIEEVGTHLLGSKKSEPVSEDRGSRNPSLETMKQEVGARP